jgi:AraC-like DNA-binding protein
MHPTGQTKGRDTELRRLACTPSLRIGGGIESGAIVMGNVTESPVPRNAMRPDWVHSTTNHVQASLGAALESEISMSRVVAALVRRIAPPSGHVERLFAAHLLQRTAWEVLRVSVRRGATSELESRREFDRIIHEIERSPWTSLPDALMRRPSSTDDVRPAQIRQDLDAHAFHTVRLHDVSRRVGCSVRTATWVFRHHYGVSMHQYVTHVRLREAMRLLVHTQDKMVTVAAAVGFRDKATLYRRFSVVLGVTPGWVRRYPARASALIDALAVRSHP